MVGYEIGLFVKEIDQNLICPICKNVCKDPVSCKHGHSFCNDCITDWLRKNSVCPVDQKFIADRKSNLMRNLALLGVISNLEVYCHSKDDKKIEEIPEDTSVGRPDELVCDWTGKLDHLQNHRESCRFQQVQCPHENCNTTMQRKDMEDHDKICEYKRVECEECSLVLMRVDLEKHKEDTCPDALIPCPNKCLDSQGLVINIKRKDAHNHLLNVCLKALSECPFKEHGCLEQVERQNVENHVQESMASHIMLLAKQNSNLAKQCSLLAQQNKKLKESLRNLEEELSSSYVWTIRDFPTKSREHPNDDWFRSPSFWLCGCKWYLKLYPNGNRKSEGFLSLSLKLDDEGDDAEPHVPWHSDSALVVPNSAISVLYKLTVMSQKPGFGNVSLESASVFQRSDGWGYTKFMETADALSDAYCNSETGALVIECTIKLCRPEQ